MFVADVSSFLSRQVKQLVREQQGTVVNVMKKVKSDGSSSSSCGSDGGGQSVSATSAASSLVLQGVSATLEKARKAHKDERAKIIGGRVQGDLPPKPQGYMAIFKST
jgi:hypothetical protein